MVARQRTTRRGGGGAHGGGRPRHHDEDGAAHGVAGSVKDELSTSAGARWLDKDEGSAVGAAATSAGFQR